MNLCGFGKVKTGVTKMKRGRKPGEHSVWYTVYDNATDNLVCLDATAEEAALKEGKG